MFSEPYGTMLRPCSDKLVRFWHLADEPYVRLDVGYRGRSGRRA
jgi:hypothetical protein